MMPGRTLAQPDNAGSAAGLKLPDRYFQLLDSGVKRIAKIIKQAPARTLPVLEKGHPFGHFPHAVLVPAVLYARQYPSNKYFHDRNMLLLAEQIGDILVKENKNGHYRARNDSDWDTYMWLEAYRLLKDELGTERRQQWGQAILENLQLLEAPLKKCEDYPWYNAPFIITSPNHYSIYASALLVGGHVFNKPDWVRLASKVLHRFCVREQTADGYWGEHSQAGPTTGYDYVTETQIALYWEYSKDPEALKALRRSTDFHKYFTYPDGTPVETINDRNRYWGVSMWGHFGFSNFADGRGYARFLTGFFPLRGDTASYGGDMQSLGRIAQNVIYFHEGAAAAIPQDEKAYYFKMHIPGGIRKSGLWVTTYSGITAPQAILNNFFLDRQGNFSVFNKKTGLIITGANSKRQPELATFTEKIGQETVHMPIEADLRMKPDTDKLALAYNVFFATIEVPAPTGNQLAFRVKTVYKWGEASTRLNLQLILKEGQEMETGTGRKFILGKDKIELGSAELGGALTHNGWTMHFPAGMQFTWPVYPFNPYKDSAETELSKAIGLLSLPLRPENQDLPFTIDVF
jgi:hypothetical protein